MHQRCEGILAKKKNIQSPSESILQKQELSPKHILCLEDSGHSFYVQMNSSLGVIEDEMIIVRGSLDLWGGEPKGFEPQVTHGWQRAIDHVTNECCEYQMSCEHQ